MSNESRFQKPADICLCCIHVDLLNETVAKEFFSPSTRWSDPRHAFNGWCAWKDCRRCDGTGNAKVDRDAHRNTWKNHDRYQRSAGICPCCLHVDVLSASPQHMSQYTAPIDGWCAWKDCPGCGGTRSLHGSSQIPLLESEIPPELHPFMETGRSKKPASWNEVLGQALRDCYTSGFSAYIETGLANDALTADYNSRRRELPGGGKPRNAATNIVAKILLRALRLLEETPIIKADPAITPAASSPTAPPSSTDRHLTGTAPPGTCPKCDAFRERNVSCPVGSSN